MNHREAKAKLLKDPDTKREYDALRDDYDRRRETIRRKIGAQSDALLPKRG